MTEKISRKLVDLAWLAGILDGEGNFYVRTKPAFTGKKYLDIKIRVNNTDSRMISKISEIYSSIGTRYFFAVRKQRGVVWKASMEIIVCRQANCLKVLEAVKPFMVSKKDQVEALLDILYYVKSIPKGGNTTSYLYSEFPHFKMLMGKFRDAIEWHFEPMFLSRTSHKTLVINENKQLVRQHIRPVVKVEAATDEDLSWLGGILDGEGSFYTGSQSDYKFIPYIDVTSTDVRVISKVSRIYESLNLRFHFGFINMKKKNPTNKNQLSLRVNMQGSMLKLLRVMPGYMINKKEQAECLRDLLSFVIHRRENRLGQYRDLPEFRELFDNSIHAKKYHQDPQRLIREANIPLDIRRESPIHVGDNVSTSERMCA
jgi:hypothetical protein